MTMWNHGASGFARWLGMGLIMLLLLTLLVTLAIWLVNALRTGPNSRGEERSALARADEVLGERFASGEIDDVEFQRRYKLLHPTART
jgi:putative membrane protein